MAYEFSNQLSKNLDNTSVFFKHLLEDAIETDYLGKDDTYAVVNQCYCSDLDLNYFFGTQY